MSPAFFILILGLVGLIAFVIMRVMYIDGKYHPEQSEDLKNFIPALCELFFIKPIQYKRKDREEK